MSLNKIQNKIMQKFKKKEEFTKNDEKWMEEHDWHPVDEFELKPEFVKEVERRSKDNSMRIKNTADLFHK